METERLVLREFGPDDAEFILKLLNEPGWKRYIGERGVDSLETAGNYIETVPLASYKKHGFGLYAVALKSNGTPVGMCGLIKRDELEDVDIGFAILEEFHGHGYAKEAALAVLQYSRDVLGLKRLLAITTEDNEPSRRVLERIGLTLKESITLGGERLRLFAVEF